MSDSGAKRNGIDNARDKVVSRGVLLDIPQAKGRKWFAPGEGILPEGLNEDAAREGAQVGEGGIALMRAGQLAMVREQGNWGDYAGGPAPGLALESLEWIWSYRIAALATDIWGAEIPPNATPDIFQPVHCCVYCVYGAAGGRDLRS